MTNRSVAMVVVYTIITLGFYSIWWFVTTKNEMNTKFGCNIPTGWHLIVPILNIIWVWKYCGGVERTTQQTNSPMSQGVAFLMVLLLGIIGVAVIQAKFNEVGDGMPAARAVG